MRHQDRRTTGFLRGSLIVIMTLALIVPSLAAKERKGASITVTKLDGKVIKGELLAVKGENLILLDRSTSSGVTESLLEIKTIKVVNKSKRVNGLVMGALAGALYGVLFGPKAGEEPDPYSDFQLTPGKAVLVGALGGVFWGALIVGVNEQIDLKKKDPENIAKISARLKKYARDRG
jgi:hypothetical protein